MRDEHQSHSVHKCAIETVHSCCAATSVVCATLR